MQDWRLVVIEFMEGRRSREDVESLLRRIDLPAHARRDLPDLLAIIDRLDDGFHRLNPAGARLDELIDALRSAPMPGIPAGSLDPSPADRRAKEAIDQYLEGHASRAILEAMLDEPLSSDVVDEIEDLLELETRDVSHVLLDSLESARSADPPDAPWLQVWPFASADSKVRHQHGSRDESQDAASPRRDVRAADERELPESESPPIEGDGSKQPE